MSAWQSRQIKCSQKRLPTVHCTVYVIDVISLDIKSFLDKWEIFCTLQAARHFPYSETIFLFHHQWICNDRQHPEERMAVKLGAKYSKLRVVRKLMHAPFSTRQAHDMLSSGYIRHRAG